MGSEEMIWVDSDLAKEYNSLKGELEKRKMFDDHMKTVKQSIQSEYKTQLESLDDDTVIFRGMLLKAKKAFTDVKVEYVESSYEVWEKFENELPSVRGKVSELTETLNPLKESLTEINDLLKKIDTYGIEKVLDVIERITILYGENKEMVKFLINNFKRDV